MVSGTRKYYADKGVTAPDNIQQTVQEGKQRYMALHSQLKVKVGAEHSWLDT